MSYQESVLFYTIKDALTDKNFREYEKDNWLRDLEDGTWIRVEIVDLNTIRSRDGIWAMVEFSEGKNFAVKGPSFLKALEHFKS